MSAMREKIEYAGKDFNPGWFKRLADYLGVGPEELDMAISKGLMETQPEWASKTAKYLGVDPKWLVSGVGEPRPKGTAPALEKSDVNTSKQKRAEEHQSFMEDMQQSKTTADEIKDHAREVIGENFMKVLYSLSFRANGRAQDLNEDIVGYVQAYGFSESAYGAIVVGDALSPRYENGEFLVLDFVGSEENEPVSMLEPGDEVLVVMTEPVMFGDEYDEFRLGKVLLATNEYVAISFKDGNGSVEEQVIRFNEDYNVLKVMAKFPKSTFFIKEDMIESNPIAVIGQLAQKVVMDGNLFEQIIPKRGG